LLAPACAQQAHRPMDADAPAAKAPSRIHLILKDGTFQLVLRYKVQGNVVRYWSAERDGAMEDVPLALVDLAATERWVREHTPGAQEAQAPSVLSPELAREEADRAARSPEVVKDLRLPEEDSVLVLDTFQGVPELVPLPQQGSDLNRETAHAVRAGDINPASSPHRLTDIPGERADIQLHVQDPAFYVHVGPDDATVTGAAFTVDTQGQSGRDVSGTGAENDYVIERIDVRQGLRQIDSFRILQLGTGHPQRDVIECKHELLPGGHWMKVTPVEPLLFGEYALIEILSDRSVNLDVWDFGVHSDAKENVEAQRPQPRRPVQLERRRP
jgi:hypothetical protein